MSKVMIAAGGRGLVRAEETRDGAWAIESLLEAHDVRCLTSDPRNPNILYAGTQGRGVFRSEDRGETWRQAGLEGHVVKSIAASAAVPGLVFAGTKPPAVFVSHDSGQHWTELDTFRKRRAWWWFTPAEAGAPYVQAVAPSPTNPDVIIAGVELGAVLRSVDGGRTWIGHLKGADRDCHVMTFHATDGNWVYEAGGMGGAFSTDGGATWHRPNPFSVVAMLQFLRGGGVRPSRNGLDRRYCFGVGADYCHPDIWYLSASPGPFKAHGNGDAQAYIFRKRGESPWEKLSGGLPQPLNHMPYALLPERDASGHLVAVLNNGDVWRTTDFGDSWRQIPVNLGRLWTAVIVN